jgi:hypothetical protein
MHLNGEKWCQIVIPDQVLINLGEYKVPEGDDFPPALCATRRNDPHLQGYCA